MTTTTATTTLTDRYVHAVTRRLPDDQREDVAMELRASIEDRVDARLAAPDAPSPADAERETLVELGDPDRLAAGYTGALQHLVGPAYYPTYVRVLRTLLLTVVPVVTAVVAVVEAFEGGAAGAAVGNVIGTAISLGVQVCFWTTLGFVVAERAGASGPTTPDLTRWSPDNLPQLPQGAPGSRGEAITNVVWLAALAALLVLQQVRTPVGDRDERIPVLDPELWSFWLPLILVGLAAEALFEVVKYRRGGTWTVRFATVNMLLGAVFAAPVAWLAAQERLLNPAFTTYVQDGWPAFDPGVTHTVILVSAVAIWLFDTVDGWRKALAA